MIPFSPPYISEEAIAEVNTALRSGWITTGPRTKSLEKKLSDYIKVNNIICLNSATAGLELMLRWYGVGAGDEVILPAYTYSATANVVIHCGATPVLVDVNADDFNINIVNINNAITTNTKVIMPVDFAGLPCEYDSIKSIILEKKQLFSASNENQEKLGRILLLCDAAHSLGARYKNKIVGSQCDATVYSFHAVKNLTTAEGGAVAINLPWPFDNEVIYQSLQMASLHGQNKSALAKTQKGNWEYDIIEPGYKCNMTDIHAALGIIAMKYYDEHTLQRRKAIVTQYQNACAKFEWAQLPIHNDILRESSYHLYALRIRNINESIRNLIIQNIFDQDVAVNVHYKPLPLLSYYKAIGYRIEDYPIAYDNYAREISLPIFYTMTDEQVAEVINAVNTAVHKYVG